MGRPVAEEEQAHGIGVGVDDRVGADEQRWFESIGGRVVTLVEPDELFVRWFAEHGTTCALQRPDFYLYGTAPTAHAAMMLLADLRHDPTQGPMT